MLASRCACVVSCDLIFTSKFSGCPTNRWPTLFAVPIDSRTSNSFDNMTYSSLYEKENHCRFISTLPQNVHGSFFPTNVPVAILAADSKRSFLRHGAGSAAAVSAADSSSGAGTGGATSNTSPLLFPGFLIFARCVGYEKLWTLLVPATVLHTCQPEMTKKY